MENKLDKLFRIRKISKFLNGGKTRNVKTYKEYYPSWEATSLKYLIDRINELDKNASDYNTKRTALIYDVNELIQPSYKAMNDATAFGYGLNSLTDTPIVRTHQTNFENIGANRYFPEVEESKEYWEARGKTGDNPEGNHTDGLNGTKTSYRTFGYSFDPESEAIMNNYKTQLDELLKQHNLVYNPLDNLTNSDKKYWGLHEINPDAVLSNPDDLQNSEEGVELKNPDGSVKPENELTVLNPDGTINPAKEKSSSVISPLLEYENVVNNIEIPDKPWEKRLLLASPFLRLLYTNYLDRKIGEMSYVDPNGHLVPELKRQHLGDLAAETTATNAGAMVQSQLGLTQTADARLNMAASKEGAAKAAELQLLGDAADNQRRMTTQEKVLAVNDTNLNNWVTEANKRIDSAAAAKKANRDIDAAVESKIAKNNEQFWANEEMKKLSERAKYLNWLQSSASRYLQWKLQTDAEYLDLQDKIKNLRTQKGFENSPEYKKAVRDLQLKQQLYLQQAMDLESLLYDQFYGYPKINLPNELIIQLKGNDFKPGKNTEIKYKEGGEIDFAKKGVRTRRKNKTNEDLFMETIWRNNDKHFKILDNMSKVTMKAMLKALRII